MKLEYLYPELGNLYGDSANMRYLRKSLPEADYIETHLGFLRMPAPGPPGGAFLQEFGRRQAVIS